MKILFGESTQTLRGWRQSEDYLLTAIPNNNYVDGVLGQFTSHDTTFDGSVSATVQNVNDVGVDNDLSNPPVTFKSNTPEICSVSATGEVTALQDGDCVIEVKGQTGKRLFSQHIYTSGGVTSVTDVVGQSEGSLRKYLQDQQLAALAGVISGPTSQRAAINPNNIDTNTGDNIGLVTPSGGTYGGVNTSNFMIAPTSEALAAGYTPLPTDALGQLLAAGDGKQIEGKAWISNHHYISWAGHNTSGIIYGGTNWMQVLNNGFGTEIFVFYSPTEWTGSLVKLLPQNYLDYMPSHSPLGRGELIHVFARMYHTYYPTGDYSSTDPTSERRWVMPVCMHGVSQNVYGTYPLGDVRRTFQRTKSSGILMCNGGDSGSPIFCGIGGDLVILSHITSLGSMGTQNYTHHKSLIDSAMNNLASAAGDPSAGSYAVQTVDLGPTGMNFTNYA